MDFCFFDLISCTFLSVMFLRCLDASALFGLILHCFSLISDRSESQPDERGKKEKKSGGVRTVDNDRDEMGHAL